MQQSSQSDMFWRRKPPPDLERYVEAFLGRRATGSREAFTVFPGGYAELLFHFADPFLTNAKDEGPLTPLAPAALLGPRSARYQQSAGPKIDWIIVQLTPLGCWRLLGMPFGRLWATDAALDEFWRGRAAAAHERLSAASDFDGRCEILTNVLRDVMSARETGDAAISALAVGLRVRRNQLVATLASNLDVSARRIHQRFTGDLGISPKAWLKLTRANRLWHALHPSGKGLDLALSEYADESHAHRELREFTGLSIGEYRKLKMDGDPLVNTGARVGV